MAPSLLLLLALLPAPADSLHPLSPDRRLAATYANDFFFGTDYYFTQGMTLDWVSPVLARSPANYLLPKVPARSSSYYGLALRYDGYTPLSIVDKRIRVGDRPYSAYFYVSMYRVSNQLLKKQRLTTALEVGYIGPAAGGKLIQTKLHELTHYDLPQGWGYQIRSDAVVGYRATYEKQLLAAGRAAALIGIADASLSTLRTYAAAGLRLRAGLFDSYFASLGTAGPRSRAGLRPWQVYAEGTLTEYLVGYDASLQGGLLNRSSPYVLKNSQIRREVLHGTGSLVVAHNGLSFTATATFIGPEFAGGRRHRWGTIGLARAF